MSFKFLVWNNLHHTQSVVAKKKNMKWRCLLCKIIIFFFLNSIWSLRVHCIRGPHWNSFSWPRDKSLELPNMSSGNWKASVSFQADACAVKNKKIALRIEAWVNRGISKWDCYGTAGFWSLWQVTKMCGGLFREI